MSDVVEPRTSQVRFYYQKSHFFRVIHADGVIGNLTPQGLLHLAVYSERTAIPQTSLHELNEDGTLGKSLETDGKEGFVREIDTDLIMTKEVAVGVRNWLNQMLKDFEDSSNSASGASNV